MRYPSLAEAPAHVADHLESLTGLETVSDVYDAVALCPGVRPGDGAVLWSLCWGHNSGQSPAGVKTEVLERLRALAVTDAALAELFGPSWDLMISLVRRAATLTPREAEQLVSAWRETPETERVSALAASGDACKAAGLTDRVIGDGGSCAVAVAVSGARGRISRLGMVVLETSAALVSGGLVGQHSLTQLHIDTLLGPWVSVLGADWHAEVEHADD